MIGHIPRDNRAGSDHRVAANRDTRIDDGMASDPDMVSDVHRAGGFEPRRPFRRIEGMSGGEDGDPRPDEAVVADSYLRAVQDDQVVVRIKMIADVDIVSVVAPEGGLDERARSARAEEPVKDRIPLFNPLFGRFIEQSAKPFRV